MLRSVTCTLTTWPACATGGASTDRASTGAAMIAGAIAVVDQRGPAPGLMFGSAADSVAVSCAAPPAVARATTATTNWSCAFVSPSVRSSTVPSRSDVPDSTGVTPDSR